MVSLVNIEMRHPAKDNTRTNRSFNIGKNMQIKLLYILGILLALSTTGCSAIWYEIMENGRVHACEPLHGQERNECLERARMPYEKYEQERTEALKIKKEQ